MTKQLVDTIPHIIKCVSDQQLVKKFHTSLNVCVTIHLVKKFHKSLNVCATIQLVDNFHTSLNVWETKTISGYISTHH